jgi:hypothetical protein
MIACRRFRLGKEQERSGGKGKNGGKSEGRSGRAAVPDPARQDTGRQFGIFPDCNTKSSLRYNDPMKTTVQARLDHQSQARLKRLVQRLGWSPSRLVREGLQLLDVYYGKRAGKRFLGIGRVDSGIADLGSNKKHLEGFGQ